MAIASFDVFDTLITRAVGTPEAVFLLLGRRLEGEGSLACSAGHFARQRALAEQRTYQELGGRTTLEAIYGELGNLLKLDGEELSRIMDLECEVETDLIRCVPGASERVRQARQRGDRVVFTSDMYIYTEFVRQQLDRFGLWAAGDGCYVSGEWGKLKKNGELYEVLLKNERASGSEVSHLGNSLERDVQPARLAGMAAELFPEGNLSRYELILEAFSETTGGLASAMAGAARMARLDCAPASVREKALIEVAAGVAAPVLAAYALWLLGRAQELHLERLYFLSRDGQVVLQVARRLAQKLGLDIDMRYLYASRQAWNLAAIRTGEESEMAWVWDETDFLSVRSLLKRVALEPEQVQAELAGAGLGPEKWEVALQPRERRVLKRLFRAGRFRRLVVEQAEQRRETLLAYLAQEGIPGEGAWGIVDLGWFGSLQNSLASVLDGRVRSQPVGFYFALFNSDSLVRRALPREAYLFDEHDIPGAARQLPDLIATLEMFCAADHGTVIGFGSRNGRYEPEIKDEVNEPVVAWGLPLVRRTIDAFVDALLLDPRYINAWAELRPAAQAVLQAFVGQPSRSEAEAWGSFPWEDGLGSETYWNRFASPYSWRDVIRMAFTWKIPQRHRSAWHAGSLELSSPGVRTAMQALRRAMRGFRSLRYRLAARARNEWKARRRVTPDG